MMRKQLWIFSLVFLSIFTLLTVVVRPAYAERKGIIRNDVQTAAADIKMDHRVGAGIMVGGASGLVGVLLDINFNPFLSLTGHVGTGYEFLAFGGKINYYILGNTIHPYISIGYANWSAKPGIRNLDKIYPGFISTDLLDATQRAEAFAKGFSIHMVYPAFGVQYIHNTRFGVSAELMYLFDVSDFQGSPYFGIETYYYF